MAQAYLGKDDDSLSADHDAFWADNEDMKEKTEAYAERAASIAQEMSFETNHPWKEDARYSPWRLRMFDLERGSHGLRSENEFERMRDLLLSWEKTRKEGAAGERSRYVILLEDLNPRVAELLGVTLEIPPEFFLCHSWGYSELSVVDQQLFRRGSSRYWQVAVPQTRTLPEATENGSYELSCGSFSRSSGTLEDGFDDFNFDSYVSYWANSYENGSWIAVILIDPHSSHLLHYPDSRPKDPEIVHLKNFEPSYGIAYREIVLGPARDDFAQPHERSLYDTVAEAYDREALRFSDDPFSATYFVRHCIRAVWEQRVWWDESELLNTVYQNVWDHKISQNSFSSEDFENRMAINNQAMSEYQQLMGTQQVIRLNRHNIRTTIHKFRPRDAYYLAQKNSKFDEYMKEEIESWKFLDEKLRYVEESLNDHMKMYSARSAMEETYEAKMQSRESMKQTKEANRQTAAANRMARSSGQLTKIATIIVPCTFVASIFSMGGDFAAGESLFYVYWIISVPITVGLLSWILHEDIAGVVEMSKGWIKSRETKPSEKSEAV
ncbi:hypothetical protein ACQKWADRAFT_312306 [Trichoderma austrokoningii]